MNKLSMKPTIIQTQNVCKLHYIKETGSAHQIRLAFAASGIPFEDKFSKENPPSLKDKEEWRKIAGSSTANIPLLQLPGGQVLTQPSAIVRVIAKMGKLGPDPNDDMAVYRTDKLIADAEDFRVEALKSFADCGATVQDVKKFMHIVVPTHFMNFEKELSSEDSEFFVGAHLTIADVCVYDAIVNYGSNRMPGDSLAAFPKLKEWVRRVEAQNGIAKYLHSDSYLSLPKYGPETLGKL